MRLCRSCQGKVAEHVVERNPPNEQHLHHKPSKIRFSETVHVREYPLMLGDLQLCRPNSYCPRMVRCNVVLLCILFSEPFVLTLPVLCQCRNTPIPVVLGDSSRYQSYQQPLTTKQPPRGLVAKTCSQQLDRLEQSGLGRTQLRRTVQEFWVGHYRFATTLLLSETSLQAKYGVTDARFLWTPLDTDDHEAMLWGPVPSRLGIRVGQTLLKKVQPNGNNKMTAAKVAKVYRKLQDRSGLVGGAQARAELLHQQLHLEDKWVPPETIVVPRISPAAQKQCR